MTDQQSISRLADPVVVADVAAVLVALGPVAVVRMVPVTVATATSTRRRTEVFLFDGAGVTLDGVDRDGHVLALAAVRAGFPGLVWDRACDYHVVTGRLVEVVAFRVPPEPDVPVVVPLGLSPLAAAPPAEVCGRCGRPFGPTDSRWGGHARYGDTPWCRACIDRCHESTDAGHQCAVCRAADAQGGDA